MGTVHYTPPFRSLCLSASLLPAASASAPRFGCVCSQIRMCLLPDSDASAPRTADKYRARKGGGLGLRVGCLKSKSKVGREVTALLKGREFKIGISKVSGSVLAAEICTGPHNRLLRRQHCSSLCSQSEGHEHVANMVYALGHNFVGFSARAWPPQYSPPSLCEQSELQCFASGLRQMPVRCPF